MNNPLAIRGSQLMTNEIFQNKPKVLTVIKWLLCITVLIYSIKFPDVIAHSIVVGVHTFYEATSFLLEELLTHSFGFDKALAQLIVFYLSIVVGIGTTVLLWRQLLALLRRLRDYLIFKLYTYKYQALYAWHSKRTDQKIKLILIHSAWMVSAFMFLLT
jgi:hypothetical protein